MVMEENTSRIACLENITSQNSVEVETIVTAWFQILSGCLGILGNLACLIVLCRRSKKDHTNWLMVTQCIADLLTSVLLVVVTINITWFRLTSFSSMSLIKRELICRLWYSRVIYFTGFAISTFNLTVISVERYLAVIHPMFYLASFKRHSTYLLWAFAWLMAPLMQVVLAASLYRYQDGRCMHFGQRPGVGTGVFVWEYLLPVLVMTYAFVKIALKLHSLGRVSAAWARDSPSVRVDTVKADALSVAEQPAPCTTETSRGPSNLKELPPSPKAPGNIRRRKTTVTMFIIYLTYMVCWTPNQFAFLVFNFGVIPEYFESTWHTLTTILASFNICVNPMVYAFRYSPFRKGIRQIFNKYFCFR